MAACAALLVLVALLTTGCSGDGASGTATTPGEPATAPEASQGPLDFSRAETVAEGLEVPWGLAFVDETTLLVTERPGRVRLIRDGRLEPEPVAELDVVAEGEAGLLGIALHPEYPADRSVYLYYTAADGNRVSRFRLRDDFRFEGEEVLLTIPSGVFHDGGRIAFGSDGLLYVATGDATQRELAADRGSLAGKLLRINPDGSAAGDNPFAGSPVFSYGHRNPQGLDWDGDGQLYASEHGPTGEDGLCCHDEVNAIRPGGFYGWPFFAGRSAADPGEPPEQPIAPIVESGGNETWAPAGLAVDDAQGVATLYVALLAGERLLRISVQGREAETDVALEGLGRLRAAELGPDSCLYLTTSNTDGRGSPRDGDDRIVRVCRSAAS